MTIEETIIGIVSSAVAEASRRERPDWVAGWKAIADHLRITEQTAMRWADKGIITVHRKGRIILADTNELDKCIKRL